MPLSSSVHDLRTLILSFHPILVIETTEEERVRGLLATVAAETGLAPFEWSVTRGLRRPGESGPPVGGTQEPLVLLKHLAGMTVDALYHLQDLGAHLKDPQVLRACREVAQHFAHTRSAIVLTGENVELPAELEAKAARYELQLPGPVELREVVRNVILSLRQTERVRVTLEPDDLDRLIGALRGMTLNQARQAVAYAALDDGELGPDDVDTVLRRKAQALGESGLLEYFPVEDNRYALAGFESLKRWLGRAKLGFSEEARALNLSPPRGLLLVGVQGCGKSLAAKVIAREWGMPLVKLDAGGLYDKYIGESEKNLRRAIAGAESVAPTVLWIDEIEKGMGTDDGGGDGGVSRRLLGTFLTWLQEKREDVFVVATANDVFALPPELVRKGRFDEIFFVDLPNADERRRVFEIHLELRKQSPKDFQLDELVDATDGFSGAEIEQAVIASLYRALHDTVALDTELLLLEIRETVPLSVSRAEDVSRLRALAKERFVPVS